MNEEKEVHICPVLMRTVILVKGQCTESCYVGEDCALFSEEQGDSTDEPTE